MKPPVPAQRDHVHHEHGVERHDPWAWLRDREDPAVLAHLRAENAHTEAATAHLADLRRTLYDELLGRIQEDDESVPAHKGGWWYVTRTVAGKAYPIHLRRQGAPDGPEQVLLDENALAAGQPYFELGAITVSPDGRTLAYATDTTGGERYALRFRDLATGEDLPDVIDGIWPDLAWASDSRTILYGRLDEAWRPHELWVHVLGQADDVRVYAEPDPRFRVFADRTADDRWLLVGSASSGTTEIHVAPADRPHGPYTLLAARHPGHEYTVTSQGERLLVLTNDADDADGNHVDDAVGFALKEARPGDGGRAAWTTILPARPGVTLEGVVAFTHHVVVLEREDGLTHLRVLGPDGADARVPMPGSTWVLEADANLDPALPVFRYSFTTLTQPPSTYDLDLASLRSTLRKVQPVRGGHDPAAYVAWRVDVPSHDGVNVPVSLVRHRDTPTDGTAPLLLYGYGAYGVTIDPSFSSTRLSLLDRGVIFAIAHVRGGAYLGRAWKEAGRFERKPNSFHDFVAAARALVSLGLTVPERLAIQGGSAGGLLVGAVLNQAPGLCRAAVAEVPFVDVVTSMLDVDLPLTTTDWEEWGDPRERAFFDVMLSYSPYDNVRFGPYPDVLATGGLNDPRVPYWEPAKWVARLRDRATNHPQVLLKMELEAGHGGKSGRYGQLEEIAFEQAWILDRLGVVARGAC